MTSFFSDEQKNLRKTVCDFASRELNPGVADRDRAGTFPGELWKRCAEMQIIALPFPEIFSGGGFDFYTAVAVFHALGYACQDSGLVHSLVTQVICGVQILLFGTQEQKKLLLPDLISGKHIYSQGITEPDAGSDAMAMRLLASKTEGSYIINGTKTMITNGPIADRMLVFAVTNPQTQALSRLSCILISKDAHGYSAGKPIEKMGLRTVLNGELVFTDCIVPFSSIIGREGQGAIILNESLEYERVLISACLLGQLERILELCVKYSRERKAFGQSIKEFQAISHKIAKMKMDVELGRLSLYNAATIKNRHDHAALESSITKLFISESLKQACLDAVQIHGSYGYTCEYGVERELRDSIASTIYSGTSEIQSNIIARLAGL